MMVQGGADSRLLFTDITQQGSWHIVGAHTTLWDSCLVDWVTLKKPLKGLKQRKTVIRFKI